MNRRSPIPAGAWPQHYTADDIAVATAAKAALAERRMTPIELAAAIRGSTGSAYQVLAGTYKDSPTHYLRRIAAALGLPAPDAWAGLLDSREVMSATVIRAGFRGQVVYPMGRVVEARPGRRRGQITIVPSNHANSVHGGTLA